MEKVYLPGGRQPGESDAQTLVRKLLRSSRSIHKVTITHFITVSADRDDAPGSTVMRCCAAQHRGSLRRPGPEIAEIA